MKINLIEFTNPVSAANNLGDMLNAYGHIAHINAEPLTHYDVLLVLFATCLNKELFSHPHPPIAVFCAGQDIWMHYVRDPYPELLEKCDLILYCDPKMQQITGKPGLHWHTPMSFNYNPARDDPFRPKATRDTLIYCPSPEIYRLDKVLEYVDGHPQEKITVLGSCYPVMIMEPRPNVVAIPRMPNNSMPHLLADHKKMLIWLKWITEPPAARLGCEALSMGLKVFCNDEPVTEIPDYMRIEEAVPRLIKILESMK